RLHVADALAHFAAIDFATRALAGATPIALGWRSVVGAASVFLLLALMRVQDELKDVETDRRLARGGDRRYVGRPLVTGAVEVADLVLLRRAVLLVLVALNAPLGFPLPLLPFGFVLGLVWLSYHW